MTQEQTEQLIMELEKLKFKFRNKGNQLFLECKTSKAYISEAKAEAYEHCIQLIKQTTVNRSSTEPKFIEE